MSTLVHLTQTQHGKVYIVDAGPGDPGLVTLRAQRCLRQAHLVIVDGFVHPHILCELPPNAKILRVSRGAEEQQNSGQSAGKAGIPFGAEAGTVAISQVVGHLVAEARQGHVAVYLCGQGMLGFLERFDELETLRQAGVDYEIVPGVPAYFAAMANAEIPITSASGPPGIILVDQVLSDCAGNLSWAGKTLGAYPGTIVALVPSEEISRWASELLRGGRAPFSPAVLVSRPSRPDQEILQGPLSSLVNLPALKSLPSPVVFFGGDSVACAPCQAWWARRPLTGQRILVTRPEDQAHDFADLLMELGADVLTQPSIVIGDPPDWGPVDEAIDNLDRYHWVVFTSANGVRFFLGRLWTQGKDLRKLGPVKIAAIGPGTAEALRRHYLIADLVPAEFRAEALAEALVDNLRREPSRSRVLLVRANRGRPVLAEMLTSAGACVHQIAAYTSADVNEPLPEVMTALNSGAINWITVTSSSIARSLARMFGPQLSKARLASISPVTSAELRHLGFEPTVEAQVYTLGGLVEAILRYLEKNSP